MVNTPQLSSFHVFVSILQATTCHSNKKWTIPSETAKKTGFGPGTMMNKGFPVIWTEFGLMLLLLHVATCCYMLLPFQPVRPARSTCWRCLCTSTCAWWQHGDFKWSDSNVVVQRWDLQAYAQARTHQLYLYTCKLTEHPRAEKHVDPPIYLLNISKPSTWI